MLLVYYLWYMLHVGQETALKLAWQEVFGNHYHSSWLGHSCFALGLMAGSDQYSESYAGQSVSQLVRTAYTLHHACHLCWNVIIR